MPVQTAVSLREVARHVADNWTSDTGDLSRTDVESELDTLVRLLEQGPGSKDKALAGPPLGFVRRRLLEQLHSQAMLTWREHPDAISAPEILRTVLAFDMARRTLDPTAESRVRGRAAPNGLELLVEVAHDFRSALSSIIYLSEGLRRGQGGDLNETQRHHAGIIYQAAVTLISTANDVIELNSAGEHLVNSDAAPFSLTHTLESVCSVVRPIAEEKGLQLSVASPRDHIRTGSAAALGRVLLNLTTNALKSTQQGGVEIDVIERGDTQVQFAVKDTGPGIPEDILATLYEPFRRTASRDSGYYFSGTGLGLAICRKLVKAMGSELHVQTSPDRGTVFFFELQLPRVAR